VPNFLHVNDLSKDQLLSVLDRARELKAAFRAGDASFQPLKGKSLAMIFAKPSLRTRVSFEVVRPSHTKNAQRDLGAAPGSAEGERGSTITRVTSAVRLFLARGFSLGLSVLNTHSARR